MGIGCVDAGCAGSCVVVCVGCVGCVDCVCVGCVDGCASCVGGSADWVRSANCASCASSSVCACRSTPRPRTPARFARARGGRLGIPLSSNTTCIKVTFERAPRERVPRVPRVPRPRAPRDASGVEALVTSLAAFAAALKAPRDVPREARGLPPRPLMRLDGSRPMSRSKKVDSTF